jgi:RNA polymerase sigma-70 factor, ECF subfamily
MEHSGRERGGGASRDADPDPATGPRADDEFISLMPLYAEAVLRVAAALVGPAEAEDVAQEALLRGWQAWPSLRDRAAARSWLLRITVNVCKDWLRGRFGTRQRHAAPLFTDDHPGEPALLTADPGASDAAAALDLRQAINSLDADLRLVVALRHYAGIDSTEIGAMLGLPPATVRTRLRRALALLRERLEPPHGGASSTAKGGR